jgi:nucleoid-associated protein YgaU
MSSQGTNSSGENTVTAKLKTHQNYQVQYGDTLWSIAYKYYGKRARKVFYLLAKENGLKSPYLVRPGQKLIIPEI